MTDLAAQQVHCDGDLVLASFLSSCLITRPGLQLIPFLNHQPFTHSLTHSAVFLFAQYLDMTLFFAQLVVHVLHSSNTVLCKCNSNTEQHYHCGPRDSGSISHPPGA